MAEPITTPDYAGPDRRRWPRVTGRPILPRWALLGLLAVAYLAIMVPLGFVLHYGMRADERAERSTRTVCELTTTVGHLADTLDSGLGVLIGENRAVAESELRRTVTEGRAQAAKARAACRPGARP